MELEFDFTTIENRDPSSPGIIRMKDEGCILEEWVISEYPEKELPSIVGSCYSKTVLERSHGKTDMSVIERSDVGYAGVHLEDVGKKYSETGLRSPTSRVLLNDILTVRLTTFDAAEQIRTLLDPSMKELPELNASPQRCWVPTGSVSFSNSMNDYTAYREMAERMKPYFLAFDLEAFLNETRKALQCVWDGRKGV